MRHIVEKWKHMTPRERDAWIAETIMGETSRKWMIPCPDGIDGCAVAHYAYYLPYTTDIAAAISVAEVFATWQVTKMGIGRPEGYRAILHANGNVAHASTASEAICLAALIAKLRIQGEDTQP